MNILIPYAWLKDYLKTDLDPKAFASLISAHGPSIEKWHQTDDGDVVFDVEVTTNRIDAFSMYGMAREAHAILQYNGHDSELIEPEMPEIVNGSGVNHALTVDIDDNLCPRFTALVLDGVKIGPSPKFITERLEKVGERGLNNVVDVTNYVMYELGQPMHVFDYDKIVGHFMKLRASKKGERLVTLDGQSREVPEGAIVIEDADKLIDLAGIMGGRNSAVDNNTTRVLLFVQTYNPHAIRKASMVMAHRTEAAARFEKGLDTESVLPALKRATQLLRDHAEAVVASDIYDYYPILYQPKTVAVSIDKIHAIISKDITAESAQNILETLGFPTSIHATEDASSSEHLIAEVPSFRAADIEIPEDLIEEIARMYGYHNIQAILPEGQIPQRPVNSKRTTVRTIKILLKNIGFTEILTNSSTSAENITKLGYDLNDMINIKNELTEDFVYMRPHLLNTMLPVVAENLPRFPSLDIFELSRVYHKTKKGLPNEITMLQIVSTNPDLLRLKGVCEEIFSQLHITQVNTIPDDSSDKYLSNTTGIFVHKDKEIGHLGLLSPIVSKSYGIHSTLSVAKLFIDELIPLVSQNQKFTHIPKYPAVIEDIAFSLDKQEPVGRILISLSQLDPLIVSVNVLDVYAGEKVGLGKKSVTFRISYQHREKLLSYTEVLPTREKLITHVEQTYNAKLRA